MNSRELLELSKKSARKKKTAQTKWDKKHHQDLKTQILAKAKEWADEGETTAQLKVTGDKDILNKVAGELRQDGFKVTVEPFIMVHTVFISWN
jgi:hypothetical protein